MGVIQEMVTLSSGMVWNIVLFKEAQSRPKYPLANHCADSTTCREAGNDMNERTYSISDLKQLTRSCKPAKTFVTSKCGYFNLNLNSRNISFSHSKLPPFTHQSTFPNLLHTMIKQLRPPNSRQIIMSKSRLIPLLEELQVLRESRLLYGVGVVGKFRCEVLYED